MSSLTTAALPVHGCWIPWAAPVLVWCGSGKGQRYVANVAKCGLWSNPYVETILAITLAGRVLARRCPCVQTMTSLVSHSASLVPQCPRGPTAPRPLRRARVAPRSRGGGAEPASGAEAPPGAGESVKGLRDWLWARGLERHFPAVDEWCLEMGAAEFGEVAESASELAEYLGDALSEEERELLLRGTQ
uniref:Uncharacterized protein n=1 Tax=Pyrodinium bahamense TaxID=73915 RepID=A0A7R9ZY62_9DINO